MKITDKFKPKETEYGSINTGIVFKYGDQYYMTTNDIENKYGEFFTCVNLRNGEFCHFDDDTMVEVLDAELIIK